MGTKSTSLHSDEIEKVSPSDRTEKLTPNDGIEKVPPSDRTGKVPPSGSMEPSVFTQNIAKQMKVKGIDDPLLQLNFTAIFSPDVSNYDAAADKQEKLQRLV